MDNTIELKNKLDEVLKRLSGEALTKKDFIKAFEGVISFLLKYEEKQNKAIDRLEKTYKEVVEKLRMDNGITLAEMKTEVTNYLRGEDFMRTMKEHEAKMTEVYDMLKTYEERIDMIPEGKKGEQGEKGENGSPDTPEELRNKLEQLNGEARLDKSAIKGLDEKIKDLDERITRIGSTRFAGAPVNTVQYADLTSQCDGSTKTFNVPLHRIVVSLTSTQAPIIYRPNVDFTTSNHTLTLTNEVSAPITGQTLLFIYIK